MVPQETPGADNKGKRVRQYLWVAEEGGEVVGVWSDSANESAALLPPQSSHSKEEVVPCLGPPALAAVVGPATGLVEVGLEVGVASAELGNEGGVAVPESVVVQGLHPLPTEREDGGPVNSCPRGGDSLADCGIFV